MELVTILSNRRIIKYNFWRSYIPESGSFIIDYINISSSGRLSPNEFCRELFSQEYNIPYEDTINYIFVPEYDSVSNARFLTINWKKVKNVS